MTHPSPPDALSDLRILTRDLARRVEALEQHLQDERARYGDLEGQIRHATKLVATLDVQVAALLKQLVELRDWTYRFHPPPRLTCPSCHKKVYNLAGRCPSCGADVPREGS